MENASSPSVPAGPDACRRWRAPVWLPAMLAVIGGLAMFVAWAQDVSGLPFLDRTWEVKAAKISRLPKPPGEREQGGWKVPIPEKLRSEAMESSAVLLEDGVPIGQRAHSAREFAVNGGGYYQVAHSSIRLRPADGSDPRRNGRRYEIRGPRPVAAWIAPVGAGLLIAGFALAGLAAGRREPQPQRERPGMSGLLRRRRDLVITCALALGIFAWRSAAVRQADSYHDGIMSVHGMPYSDAICWNEIAISAAEGRGLKGAFDGQRPFYAVLTGTLHAVLGPSARHGLWINALGFSLAAALVYLAGTILATRSVGLAGAAVMLMGGEHYHLSNVLMTETAGFFLTVLSVVLALIWLSADGAVERGGRRFWRPPGWVLLGGSGLFFGLANLTCPFTLLAAPLYCLLLYVRAWRRGRGSWRGRWWRSAVAPAIFSLGVFAVLTPWLVRQKTELGQATLSMQTGELLYSAALPQGATAARAQGLMGAPELHSLAERNRYFMARFGEVVKADPVGYARHILTGVGDFFSFRDVVNADGEVLVVLVLLVSLALRWRHPRRLAWLVAFFLVAPAMVLVLRLPAEKGLPAPLAWIFGASVLATVFLGPRECRVPAVWLAATMAGCAGINALTGNLIARRAWVFADWNFWLLYFAAAELWLRTVAGLLCRVSGVRIPAGEPGERLRSWPDARRFALTVSVLVLTFTAAGGTILLTRKPVAEDPSAGLAAATAWTRGNDAAGGDLATVQAIRPGDYRCFIPARVEASNFSRAFGREGEDRTLVLARMVPPLDGKVHLLMLRFPGNVSPLPPDQPYFVSGIMDEDPDAWLGHDPTILQVRALVPADAAWQPDFSRALTFPAAVEVAGELPVPASVAEEEADLPE